MPQEEPAAMPQEHIASVMCWCRPVRDEEEPTVWVHSDSARHADTDTEMWNYQPSPHAVTQGEVDGEGKDALSAEISDR
jgi:hypothetical protein